MHRIISSLLTGVLLGAATIQAQAPRAIDMNDLARPTGTTFLHTASTLSASPNLLVFSAFVGHGNPPPQSVSVTRGAGTYHVTSRQAAWLTVTPRSGAVPGSLSVKADGTGLRPGTYEDKITVSSDSTTDTVRVALIVIQAPGGGQFAIYDVELTFTGYVGLVSGAPNCRVRTQGYDRLIGTVSGLETSGDDDDVIYSGILRRDTDIDFCETRKSPTVDQRGWCVVSLKGSAVTEVELTVAFDSLAGAYMKAKPSPGPVSRSVNGDCDAQETNDARDGYPTSSDGGAASPNGQQLDDIKGVDPNNQPQTLSANGVARLRVGTYPPTQPGGWTLRVIRKVP
jgi:hypothetical protein